MSECACCVRECARGYACVPCAVGRALHAVVHLLLQRQHRSLRRAHALHRLLIVRADDLSAPEEKMRICKAPPPGGSGRLCPEARSAPECQLREAVCDDGRRTTVVPPWWLPSVWAWWAWPLCTLRWFAPCADCASLRPFRLMKTTETSRISERTSEPLTCRR